MFYLHRLKNYNQEKNQFKSRVIKAALLITVLIIILIARLFNLQILQYKFYTNLSEHNQLDFLPIESNRGLIYDRNGILLAENLPLFSLNIIPELTQNINNTIDTLKTIINITPDNIQQFNKTLKQRRRFEHVPIKFKLTQEEVAIFYLNQYRFPGVVVETQMIRHYPLGKIMASALGYVGRINQQELKNIDTSNYSATHFIGKIGIEKYYEKQLHGKTGYKVAEVSATGRIVRILKIIQPIPGNTLSLTIDSKLQQVAQDALGIERGAVVAIDPNNGEVLALVSFPSFDPNLFASGIDSTTFNELQSSSDKPMYNRATLGSYPLASTIKPFIALQGLDTGIITSNFKISDPGWFKLPNVKRPYRDWVYHGHGIVNVTKAIIVSCDTFFYTLALKLGIEKIDDILMHFGFGNKTKIDMAEENSGVIASPKWKASHKGTHWYVGDTVISSIGQGFMSATPLQLACGVAAIAMHGKRFQPHLLLATKRENSTLIKQEALPLSPITLNHPNNWNIIIDAMQGVITSPMGTARPRFGSIPEYTIAAKTGGGQLFHHKIVNENPDPESDLSIPKHLRNHNLFIAFAPVENPKIAIAVVTENSIIAPQVARKVLDYYLITPNLSRP
ncbi:peptidoglycan DD-transpeptidase MrdA [Gammaproteobacteria bacterium]